MTALGVQVVGTVLNKKFSMGDDLWGLPWAELPLSLQVYGIGDIQFGYICYSVLAGIMMRDLFSELEIVCKILGTEQGGAVSWILEWIVKILEGVELHSDADEKASTRGFGILETKLINLLHLTYIVIWTKLIGGWPLIVNGGCRFGKFAGNSLTRLGSCQLEDSLSHGRILLSPSA